MMKRLTGLFAVVLLVAAIAPVRVAADADTHSLTGAAKGAFAPGATLGVVALNGIELGTGAFIEADGSASGTFHATLQGSALGLSREVVVEGTVNAGSIGADGRATVNGTASIDFGDGTPPLPSVPFTVIAGADGVVLVIDGVSLPAAGLTAGAVTIE